MQSISTRDAAALLEIVYEGAGEQGREPFPSRVLCAIGELIPCDAFLGYEEADVSAGFRVVDEIDVVGELPSPALIEAFGTLGWQNPLRGSANAREHRVLRLSDFLTARERRRLEFDAVVWRPLGIDDGLRLWLPAPTGRTRAIYFERSGPKYTTRELTLVSILRPHLVRMRDAAELRRRLGGYRGLTSREAEVLGWIARGKTNGEIGRLLVISPHTVRTHVENIFEKLDVHTRTAAAACVRGVPAHD